MLFSAGVQTSTPLILLLESSMLKPEHYDSQQLDWLKDSQKRQNKKNKQPESHSFKTPLLSPPNKQSSKKYKCNN